jgi:AcrR family transcriptional regulator
VIEPGIAPETASESTSEGDSHEERGGRSRSGGRRDRGKRRASADHGPRRTQAQRSAETRTKLLDATAANLAEFGYARTSTTDICRRAGVSRGAMLHHFPSKAVLVAAACEYVFQLSVEEFRTAMGAVPDDDDRLDAAIDVLWTLYQGDTIAAWVELIVAGRTDPDLQPHVALAAGHLNQTIQATWNELFVLPADTDPAMADQIAAVPMFLFAVLDGLGLARMSGMPTAARDAEHVLALVKLEAANLKPLLPLKSSTPTDPLAPEDQP